MAVIANQTGNTADGENFTSIAHSYIDQWQGFGIAMDATPPHTTLGYGLNDTHGRFSSHGTKADVLIDAYYFFQAYSIIFMETVSSIWVLSLNQFTICKVHSTLLSSLNTVYLSIPGITILRVSFP